MNLLPVGAYWDKPSLVWGRPSGEGDTQTVVSPLGFEVQTLRTLSEDELALLFLSRPTLAPVTLGPILESFGELLKSEKSAILETLRAETGFTHADIEEIHHGLVSLVERFDPIQGSLASYTHADRKVEMVRVPWGTVAAILPQNAFPSLALTCLFHALSAGNRVILRAPSSCARSAGILGRMLLSAGVPGDAFSIVCCNAGQFMSRLLASEVRPLVHFMGGSSRAPELLAQTFQAGCPCLIDGEGNAWLYVDQDQDPDEAAKLVWQGGTRFNGQTCTSVNGVFAHPSIDARFRFALRQLVGGSHGSLDGDGVGPVFTSAQAEETERKVTESSGRLGRTAPVSGSLFPPTLIEDPELSSSLVKEGIFAPAMWVRSGTFDEFAQAWKGNRYPLCGAVLSNQIELEEVLSKLSGASRIVLNGDPSLEDPMEPWGGYPPCGANPVGNWSEKYSRTVQIDLASN